MMTETAVAAQTAPTSETSTRERVVYLLGAGATQGCISFKGSGHSLIMPGLAPALNARLREHFYSKPEYTNHVGLRHLINEVIDEGTDFEQLITFLEEAPSETHREFAAGLKEIFSTVLRARLDEVRNELGEGHSQLYAALIDMHELENGPEVLAGFMTLNYDVFLEHAIEQHHRMAVDYGIGVGGQQSGTRRIRVLKLHGSFGWADQWPVVATRDHIAGLWIPPGIRKAKTDYPFNAIWGLAREMLDCDVVRVIGCNLGPNDWDLVSLLFSTMHTHADAKSYRVEVIGWPDGARRISDLFPYLRVSSLLEVPDVGPHIVGEVAGLPPTDYLELNPQEQEDARSQAQRSISNPFEYWLRLKGEVLQQDMPLDTSTNIFREFVEDGR